MTIDYPDFQGNVAIVNTVTITGAVTVSGPITVTGSVSITGTTVVSGTVAVSGTVTVTGTVNVGMITAGTVDINGPVTVENVAGSTLSVVKPQTVLATEAGTTTTATVTLPANCATLILLCPLAASLDPTVAGVTSSYVYPAIPIPSDTPGTTVWLVGVAGGGVDNQVTVTWPSAPGATWYVISDTENRLVGNVSVSDGQPGWVAPNSAIQVAGTDGTVLRALLTDTSGHLQLAAATTTAETSLESLVTTTGTTTLQAFGATGSRVATCAEVSGVVTTAGLGYARLMVQAQANGLILAEVKVLLTATGPFSVVVPFPGGRVIPADVSDAYALVQYNSTTATGLAGVVSAIVHDRAYP